jgi:kinesin family protein 6/9
MSGSETWKQRGIMPRSFAFIFNEINKRPHLNYNVYASYLEIYNENGYDLLDQRHSQVSLEDWSKIELFEDEFGNIHLKNLSIHKVGSEDEALNLLMMGNFIRQVSTTPMNLASSRSHCIFTIAFESRDKGTGVIKTSKLHLVDLAGSERVFKKNKEGMIIEEAKYINLSLSYLEHVIIALHDKAKGNRVHIPYRNSMMTTILRDSLGGNCRTVMIANLSAGIENINESISTARFAQRCSMLVNEVYVNQYRDVNLRIKELEYENAVLRKELTNTRKKKVLTEEEKSNTEKMLNEFIKNEGEGDPLLTYEELAYGVKHMKELILLQKEKYDEEIEYLKNQLSNSTNEARKNSKEKVIGKRPVPVVLKIHNPDEDAP